METNTKKIHTTKSKLKQSLIMQKRYPHYGRINCNCRYCTGNNQNIHLTIARKRYNELNKKFSYTIPNAKCPICSKPVFFYQNQLGSKVFFNHLGKPWEKHTHENLFSDKQLPLINDEDNIIEKEYTLSYFPIKVKFIKRLLHNYFLFEFTGGKLNKEQFVTESDLSGIIFFEINNGETYINGFNHLGEFTFKCYSISEAKKTLDVFPYVIGEPTLIEIKKENDCGIRTEIFFHRPLSIKQKIKNKAYIYNSTLSKSSKMEINQKGVIKIKATSSMNFQNEIIFKELHE